jgi:tetratricopeptide (TPR) repeat protein
MALLIAIAVGGSAWFWLRTAGAAPRSNTTARLAILPVSVADDDRELQMVAMSVADLLEQRLGRVGSLRVRGADYSRPVSITAPNLAEIGRRLHVEHVISGSVSATQRGDRARLTLVLHEIRANGAVRDTPLGSFYLPLLRRSEDIAHYAVLRDRVVSRVVATVLPAFDLRSQGASTPRDFDSYRLYLLARERLAAGGCDGEAAIELLRRSLEIDDRFAPAWDAYGWALYRLSAVCTGGSQYHRAAQEAADRALALDSSTASAIVLKARIMMETGRLEEAYRLVQQGLRNDSANADLHRAHVAILAQTGLFEAAEPHVQRVVNADAGQQVDDGVIATAYLYAGNLRRFVETLPESDAPRYRYARGFAELMQGNPDAAHAILEPSFRSNPADAYARLSHALLAIIEGHQGEARAIVAHFVRQREHVGETDAEMTYRIAQLAALAGDSPLAMRELDRAIRQGFLCVELIERDPALVSIRRTPEHARLVETARTRRDAFAARVGLKKAAETQPAPTMLTALR